MHVLHRKLQRTKAQDQKAIISAAPSKYAKYHISHAPHPYRIQMEPIAPDLCEEGGQASGQRGWLSAATTVQSGRGS